MDRIHTLGRHMCPNKQLKQPIKVTVTGAAGNIGYAFVFFAGQGRLFGQDQPIDLTLLELPNSKRPMMGTVMELDDCAYPLLANIRTTTSIDEAFVGCQVAVLVGAKPRGPGMERKDLLSENGKIFKAQGEAIDRYADRDCKVLVVGNPANTNCLIVQRYAPSIPKQNFTAMTRLDQNRADSILASKIGVHSRQIRNLIIWGNHSATQVPDASQGIIMNYPQPGMVTAARGAVSNDKWLTTEFVETVAKRGAAIIQMREKSSAASAASAACDHIHDWFIGTQSGQIVSMAVISDGSYGVPEGLCFSYPVTCQNGKWQIVQGLQWDELTKKRIEVTTKELIEERDLALQSLAANTK
ncbi:cytoplasmic and cytosolic malate dehydrogenase family protein (macronuclear) [Tetrahymena thermophila SB210]|uniref:Malate dehydrogenase n=1 Tax=Tetrahymena thermophila (strain SB210) TaxID=312017 RepID=I7MIK7_TETTS|nr:cytoplasmic and cytosolic malate dehydrogenase family protein [Tetrahymena thermophila SB210]EAS04535.1 cytoplasmic and cytosolic malate dehydrogenase family protein [Tetrahymena thermophila SB210]|eukprot:XP_001024780.1 cytoplasmic and cytosolic malate dehydrogenase family protein [Tetrahymena thermophila SB210]